MIDMLGPDGNVPLHLQRCMQSFNFSNIEEITTKNLQNKKKFEKSPKEEEGGNHGGNATVHFFTPVFLFLLGLNRKRKF